MTNNSVDTWENSASYLVLRRATHTSRQTCHHTDSCALFVCTFVNADGYRVQKEAAIRASNSKEKSHGSGVNTRPPPIFRASLIRPVWNPSRFLTWKETNRNEKCTGNAVSIVAEKTVEKQKQNCRRMTNSIGFPISMHDPSMSFRFRGQTIDPIESRGHAWGNFKKKRNQEK